MRWQVDLPPVVSQSSITIFDGKPSDRLLALCVSRSRCMADVMFPARAPETDHSAACHDYSSNSSTVILSLCYFQPICQRLASFSSRQSICAALPVITASSSQPTTNPSSFLMMPVTIKCRFLLTGSIAVHFDLISFSGLMRFTFQGNLLVVMLFKVMSWKTIDL